MKFYHHEKWRGRKGVRHAEGGGVGGGGGGTNSFGVVLTRELEV